MVDKSEEMSKSVSRSEQLAAWASELNSQLAKVDEELKPLLARKEDLRTRLDLVRRLRELEDGTVTKDGTEIEEYAPRSVSPSPGSALQAAARDVLEAHGKPMRVREIRAALIERGIQIPGRGTDANVILYLRRARNIFDRCGRGIYGLAAWKSDRKRKDS